MTNVMKLNNKITADLIKYNYTAKYANHSCSSNFQVTVQFTNRILRLDVFAIRSANINEKITFNYEQDLELNHESDPYYYELKN